MVSNEENFAWYDIFLEQQFIKMMPIGAAFFDGLSLKAIDPSL
ncbi:MAG: hypothetical protein ACR2QF_12710 [Geminicoccaceae bacterium]